MVKSKERQNPFHDNGEDVHDKFESNIFSDDESEDAIINAYKSISHHKSKMRIQSKRHLNMTSSGKIMLLAIMSKYIFGEKKMP